MAKLKFRGAEFYVDELGFGGGRNLQKNEAAFAPSVTPDETGKKAGSFSFTAYVFGPDYIEQTKKLIKACHESSGPGLLEHPIFGNIKCICKSISQKNTTSLYQRSTFSISFEQVDDKSITVTENYSQKALLQAAALKQQVSENFTSRFNVKGSSSFVVDKAKSEVQKIADYIKAKANTIKLSNDSIAGLGLKINDIKNEIDSLIALPDQLATDLQNAIEVFQEATGIDIDDSLFPDLVQADIGSTIATSRAETNSSATNELFQGNMIATVSSIAVGKEYTNTNEAEKERGVLIAAIDSLQANTIDDNLFQSLEDLKVSLSQAIPKNENLPSLFEYEVNDNKTSIELSFELFDDLEKESEILDRNKIENPAFIPFGSKLEVLDD